MSPEEPLEETDREAAVDAFMRRQVIDAQLQERTAGEGLDIHQTDPITTTTTRALPKSQPAPSRTTASDLAIVKAISEANGELIGRVRREIDGELKSLREELEALRQEVASLKSPGLRAVA